MYEYKFKVTRVIDGDTIVGDIDLGFDVILKSRVIRLWCVNTPELRSKNPNEKLLAKKAKKFVKEQVLGKDVYLTTIKDKKGSFGRVLGVIEWTEQIGNDEFPINLASALIEEKLAVPYNVKDGTKVNKALMEELIKSQ